jgi:glycosyltransferase involved in cell wall biosynthesis
VRDWTAENSEKPTLVELPGRGSERSWLTKEERTFVAQWLQPSDIVHLHGMWEFSLHQVAKVCRQKGIPYCVSSHGMLDDWSMSQGWLKKRLFWYLFGRSYLGGAFAIHTTAMDEKRQVEPWVLGRRVTVVPLIFELDAFKNLPGPELAAEKYGIVGDERIVLFLSRIHPKKGVELLIDAMQIVLKRGLQARALLAGPGDRDYIAAIQKVIREKHLEDSISLIGPVHGEAKLSLYQRADVFALPTHQENFGFVLPEAMACGTPVITTKGVDIWRELQAGGARIVDRTAESFAQEIIQLLGNDQVRASLGRQGRAMVFDTLETTRVLRQFLDLYEIGIGRKQHVNQA